MMLSNASSLIIAAMSKKKPNAQSGTIALNKRARHDYSISDRYEAGLSLQGWEVKSLRESKAQITDTYVVLKDNEAFLIGMNISPLLSASTHFVTDPARTRKLLLHRKELDKLREATQQKGYTCVCTALYWKKHLVKAEIGLAKGKKDHDKRETEKARDWDRQKQRLLRQTNA